MGACIGLRQSSHIEGILCGEQQLGLGLALVSLPAAKKVQRLIIFVPVAAA